MGKIFKTYSQKEVKRVMPIVNRITPPGNAEINRWTVKSKDKWIQKTIRRRKNIRWYFTRKFCSS